MKETAVGPNDLEKKINVSFAGFWNMSILHEISDLSVTHGCSDFDGLCSVNPALMPLDVSSVSSSNA